MYRLNFFLFLFFFFPTIPLLAALSSVGQLSSVELTDPSLEKDLLPCTDEELGVKLLCNPDWELQTDSEAILLIISSDPAVTLTIARQKSHFMFAGHWKGVSGAGWARRGLSVI